MHEIHYLPAIIILLAAAVVNASFFRRLNLSPVLGYLAGGAAIGPYGFGIIEDVHSTSAIAEFGVVFLLFVIGLELSFKRLREMRKHVFGLGTLQVAITALLIGAGVHYLGFPIEATIIIAGGLAFSSTALVLQVIAENQEKSTQVGRVSLSILLLQDLAVVPLLVLLPLLAAEGGSIASAMMDAGVRAVIALMVIFIAGRLFLRPLFRLIASLNSPEIFAAFTLLVVLGVSYATSQAGLSLALGAFIAGLLVAETEYKHQVEGDILPYKGLFMGLFFMVVGMSVDFQLMLDNFFIITGLAIALMVGKAAIVLGLCRAFKLDHGTALRSGLLLSQGGEFAFVLFNVAFDYGLLEKSLTQFLLILVTVTMALTPLAYMLGKALVERLDIKPKTAATDCKEETIDLDNHVIISGFGRVGQTIAKLLTAENINYIALDMDPAIVTEMRKHGLPVYYGDCTRREVLTAMGMERARSMIVTVNDFYTAERTLKTARDLSRRIPLTVRTSEYKHIQKLESVGACVAVSEMFEASLQLGATLLRQLGVPEHEITRITELYRSDDYALTRAAELMNEAA